MDLSCINMDKQEMCDSSTDSSGILSELGAVVSGAAMATVCEAIFLDYEEYEGVEGLHPCGRLYAQACGITKHLLITTGCQPMDVRKLDKCSWYAISLVIVMMKKNKDLSNFVISNFPWTPDYGTWGNKKMLQNIDDSVLQLVNNYTVINGDNVFIKDVTNCDNISETGKRILMMIKHLFADPIEKLRWP